MLLRNIEGRSLWSLLVNGRSAWIVIASFTVIVGVGSISLLSSSSLRCTSFALVFGILRCCCEHRWFVAAVSAGTLLLSSCKLIGVVMMHSR